jgi:hypothetical protein
MAFLIIILLLSAELMGVQEIFSRNTGYAFKHGFRYDVAILWRITLCTGVSLSLFKRIVPFTSQYLRFLYKSLQEKLVPPYGKIPKLPSLFDKIENIEYKLRDAIKSSILFFIFMWFSYTQSLTSVHNNPDFAENSVIKYMNGLNTVKKNPTSESVDVLSSPLINVINGIIGMFNIRLLLAIIAAYVAFESFIYIYGLLTKMASKKLNANSHVSKIFIHGSVSIILLNLYRYINKALVYDGFHIVRVY